MNELQKLITRVAMIKQRQEDGLCFIFHGAYRKVIEDTFSHLKSVCQSQIVTEPVNGMTNGRCHRNIIARISDMQSIREEELTTMVVHFLQKKGCLVQQFDDYQKFLNA